MSRIGRGLGRFIGVLVVALAIVVVNLGYGYRSECATETGGVRKSWSWEINNVIPYLAPSETGCEVHSALRVLSSSVGIAKINSGNTVSREQIDASVQQLGSLKDRQDEIDKQYVQDQQPVSEARKVSVAKFWDELALALPKWRRPIAQYTALLAQVKEGRAKAETLPASSEVQTLVEAWRALERNEQVRVDGQIATVAIFQRMSDTRAAPTASEQQRITMLTSDVDRLNAEFEAIAKRLNASRAG